MGRIGTTLAALVMATSVLSCSKLPEVLDEDPLPRIGDCGQPTGSFTREVLIVYETAGPYGYLGAVNAQLVMNLLGHFGEVRVEARARSDFRAGDLADFDVLFVLGTSGEEPLTPDLKTEFWSTDKPVIWMGFGLWEMVRGDEGDSDAALQSAFEARFGFETTDTVWPEEDQVDCDDFYDEVWYRGSAPDWTHFEKQSWFNPVSQSFECDPFINVVHGMDPDDEDVVWIERSPTDRLPYVIHKDNLWFVTDVPFSYLHYGDRSIVIADLLHDMIGVDHPVSRNGLIRLEDVHPLADAGSVSTFGDELGDRPWNIALIPEFRDPLGVQNNGRPYYTSFADRRAGLLRDAITEQLEGRDVGLILHGYTHQYGFEANDFNGLTGNDYEFWDAVHDRPVPDDSFGFVAGRVGAGEFRIAEVDDDLWIDRLWAFEFPHYKASLVSRLAIGEHFCTTYHGGEYWDWQGEEADGGALGINVGASGGFDDVDWASVSLELNAVPSESQFFPYLIGRDVYGQRVIPENLGSFTPLLYSYDYDQVNEVGTIVENARLNLVGRCATASFFFHPFLVQVQEGLEEGSGTESLQLIVTGIEGLGYEFRQASELQVPMGIDRL